eukprot:TRINITY_DN10917_c0_g1_i1.p2 TRINITY_DN10917_c0_g1~~TRINITY_DN10917_c0_g1_i1.p2  ORF type:complete len:143 (+),score=10.65 TRINITY_DN10917_c0_g1_i1:1008-1436(+)
MEPAHLAAELLYVDVLRGEEEVEAAPRVGGQWFGFGGDGAFYNGLDRKAGQGFAVGVEAVVLLLPKPHYGRDIGAGLVCVEPDGRPPPMYGRPRGFSGGYGADEAPDDLFLRWQPRAIPDRMDGYVCSEYWAHVVPEVHEFG